jgi:hypothetical protein
MMGYTGKTRRRWFLFTQYEYEFHGYVGARWQTPFNSDRWPICRAWTYAAPNKRNSVGFLHKLFSSW